MSSSVFNSINEETMVGVDEFLFGLCCNRWHSSEQQALDSLLEAIEDQNNHNSAAKKVTVEHVAVFALLGYQSSALPTPRQHILRMIRTFCPDQCTNLVDKLDGASETQLLEVLSALQKQYGLVLGNDVAISVDPMQLLLLRNQTLLNENVALKEQLSELHTARAYAASHQELIEHLYRCTAMIDVMRKENEQLKNAQRIYLDSDDDDGLGNHNSSSSGKKKSKKIRLGSEENGGENGEESPSVISVWAARSEALHQRIAQLVAQQIDERTQHSASIRDLSRDLEKQRKIASEATLITATLKAQLATLEAAMNGVPVRCASCAARETSTIAVQTMVVVPEEPCTNKNCVALEAEVANLTARLRAATEALQRRL